jgi:methyl-accepting chemotaxis protein
MKTTSIKTRLVLGLATIVVFLVAQAILVFTVGRSIERDVVDAARKNTLASTQLSDLAVLAQQIRRYEKEYFVYVGDAQKRAGYAKEWATTASKMSKGLEAMRTNENGALTTNDLTQVSIWWGAADFYSGEMKRLFASVESRAAMVTTPVEGAAAPFVAVVSSLAVSKGSKVPEPALVSEPAVIMYTSTEVNDMIKVGKDRLSNELIKGVAAMSAEKSKATLALSSVAAQGFDKLIYGVLVTVLVGIAIAALLIVVLPRGVSQPIQALTETIDALSKGNTEVAVSHGGVKEFEGLAGAMERMRVAQQIMMQRLRSRA